MGIIKRQGFYYTLISYTGVLIGTINTLFLYVRILETDQIGEWNNLTDIGLLFTQLAQIGLPSIISRYFPRFRSDDKIHGGLTGWVFIMGAISFLATTILFLLLKDTIIHWYTKSPYFPKIILLVIPYSFFLLANALLDILSRVIYKGLLFSFMNEVVVRLGTSIGLVLYFFKLVDFYQFLLIYIGLTGSITLALFFQIWRSGEFKLKIKTDFFKVQTPALIQYGFFTVLAGSTFLLVQKLDKIFLTIYQGDKVQGVYSIFLYIIAVIRIPSIAIGRVSYQLVADFWENKNIPMVEEIYKKTSLVQMIIGLFLFIGLALNKEFLVFVLHKPAYQNQFPIFYILGLAVLVDTTTGLNTYILTVSHKYKISTGILGVSVLVCGLANWILTPKLGATGAALSLFITYFFYNFFNTLYLQIRFKLQPFSPAHIKVAMIGLTTFLSIYFIPNLTNHYLDVIIRAVLTSLIFGGLILGFKVSEDINDQVQVFLNKGIRIFKKD